MPNKNIQHILLKATYKIQKKNYLKANYEKVKIMYSLQKINYAKVQES